MVLLPSLTCTVPGLVTSWFAARGGILPMCTFRSPTRAIVDVVYRSVVVVQCARFG